MNDIRDRYLADNYLEQNPTWDIEDSDWKAGRVVSLLNQYGLKPEKVCEVGCGAGRILESLAKKYPKASFSGYDIAPSVAQFWEGISDKSIQLKVGNFFTADNEHYDIILLLDILEHVADPHEFLVKLKYRSDHMMIHFPLDLSALSVLREKPLLYVRRKVGHIHSFTKGLALELLEECGFEVLDWQYTGAAFSTPQAGLKTRIAQIPRRIVYMLNKDFGVRLLGGETLMVLVKTK